MQCLFSDTGSDPQKPIRYIATVETSKQRVFQFLNVTLLPDIGLVALASDQAFHLGVLQSRPRLEWTLRAGGWLGIGE